VLYEAHQCQPAAQASNSGSVGAGGENDDGGNSVATSGHDSGGFSAFSLDDVDAAFAEMSDKPDENDGREGRMYGIKALKYNEQLEILGYDMSITPINAGRIVGGTMWRIRWQTDEVGESTGLKGEGRTSFFEISFYHLFIYWKACLCIFLFFLSIV